MNAQNKPKDLFQVVFQEPHISIGGNTVWEQHETRVFAVDEIDAECRVADRHPNGYGFWAIKAKDLDNYPDANHQKVWLGSY